MRECVNWRKLSEMDAHVLGGVKNVRQSLDGGVIYYVHEFKHYFKPQSYLGLFP